MILFSAIGFFVALATTTIAVPWGTKSMADLAFRVAETAPDLGIKERVFSEPFDNLHFYVGGFSAKEKEMRDVFVVDRRDPALVNTIVADRGAVVSHPTDRVIVVHFEEGAIFTVGRDLAVARTIEFKTYDLSIGIKDLFATLSSRKKKPSEMSVSELAAQVRKRPEGDPKRNEYLAELVEKLTLPFGVFLMGLTGAPLGAQTRLRGRAKGIAVSLLVFLSYYVFMGGMRNICEAGGMHPMAGSVAAECFFARSMLLSSEEGGFGSPPDGLVAVVREVFPHKFVSNHSLSEAMSKAGFLAPGSLLPFTIAGTPPEANPNGTEHDSVFVHEKLVMFLGPMCP